MLPSTKPHQNTKCLPSPHSDFHITHTRNYKTALHISSIFKKEEFTFTIHSLPHWCICKNTPLPNHIIMKTYRSHRGKHQQVPTSTTEACILTQYNGCPGKAILSPIKWEKLKLSVHTNLSFNPKSTPVVFKWYHFTLSQTMTFIYINITYYNKNLK